MQVLTHKTSTDESRYKYLQSIDTDPDSNTWVHAHTRKGRNIHAHTRQIQKYTHPR